MLGFLHWLGLPIEASSHAAEIDRMIVLVHWLMLVLFVGWAVFFVYVLFRFRKGANPKADYTGAHGKISKGLEVGVVIVEMILLVFFAIPAWARRVTIPTDQSNAVIVRIVAEQFAWNVHYPGPDGKFGRTDPMLVAADNPIGLDRTDPDAKDDITTINQLNLPVNRPVLIHLTSKDVIHSLGLYEMRVKQDAIPGLDIPVWFIPTKTTAQARQETGNPNFDFEITCSQLCGLGHYRMRGFVTVQTEAEYEAWLADQERQLRQQ
jgi:cytochrome c oxidase subunit 2